MDETLRNLEDSLVKFSKNRVTLTRLITNLNFNGSSTIVIEGQGVGGRQSQVIADNVTDNMQRKI